MPSSIESNPDSLESQFTSQLAKSARTTARRKARLNVYFREECEDRNVSGKHKAELSARYTSFIEEHITKTMEFATVSGGSLAEAFVVDYKAWESFKVLNFDTASQSIDTRISFECILKPRPNANTSPPRTLDVRNTQALLSESNRIYTHLSTANHDSPKSFPARKPGWKKESECSLLKGVLVSNAIKIEHWSSLNADNTTYSFIPYASSAMRSECASWMKNLTSGVWAAGRLLRHGHPSSSKTTLQKNCYYYDHRPDIVSISCFDSKYKKPTYLAMILTSIPPIFEQKSILFECRTFIVSATTATVACPIPQRSVTNTQSKPHPGNAAHEGKNIEHGRRGSDIAGLSSTNLTNSIPSSVRNKRTTGPAHGMKLWMMVCAEDAVEYAYTKPGTWATIGPTSFSYREGLDLTPSSPTAESWGHKLYDNDPSRRKCVVHTDPRSNTKHEKGMIKYTIQNPNGRLKMLDLDALARDPAQVRKLIPGAPPPNLVEWWFKESQKLTEAYGVPNAANTGVDALYTRADIIAGIVPTGDSWIPGTGSGFRIVMMITHEGS
ncbi:hypothetical protein J3R30DRAFT_3409722 [Lentinula aciculospora]|uniref:Uncharacterized protein n=1 Tax=Lentinula aciculospora TaxID=153920 RepID=A0A9W9DG84_9AGAR|nr:hypothetical protein J3R30DRAFT_3409722 [Lentinula aciculospora]